MIGEVIWKLTFEVWFVNFWTISLIIDLDWFVFIFTSDNFIFIEAIVFSIDNNNKLVLFEIHMNKCNW